MARDKANPVRGNKAVRDWSRLRLSFVAILFAMAWGGLWGRAYYVQIIRGPALAEQANRQHIIAEFEHGVRGEIFDRNGRILAKSVRFTSVYAKPLEIEKPAETAKTLAKILDDGQNKLAQKLAVKHNFVWLARQIGDKAAAQIRDLNIQGVYLTTEYSRLYPNGSLAGQLLGFVGVDDQGLEGIEKLMQPVLAGGKAEYVVQRDASGRKLFMDAEGREVGTDGRDVRLTIDANIQFAAEEALAKSLTRYNAKDGMCLVVKVDSGEILAWAEAPSFNPNVYRDFKPAAWRNRIVTDVYEPGSTMKSFLIAAALEEKVCNKDSLYFCENGKWKVPNGFVIKDDKHHYEWLPVHKILRYSSNIGAGKIGLALGASRYNSYLAALGFGERTNLHMPGESKGILRPLRSWGELDLITSSFGQGVGMTMLQLTRGYLCLASGGILKPLKLVLDPDQTYEPERRVFSQRAADGVLTMLKEVVEEDGTGTLARIPGLVLGGKTGTAQKAKAGGGYGDKIMASFVGLVPADKPEYLVMTIIDEPDQAHYGGVVAAPVVREVVIKTLAYAGKLPDAPPDEDDVPASRPAPNTPALDVAKGGKTLKPGAKPAQNQLQSQIQALAAVEKRVQADGQVPDLTGLPLRKAVEILSAKGIVPVLQGQGIFVAKQSPAPGESLPGSGTDNGFTLWLSNTPARPVESAGQALGQPLGQS